MSRETQGGRVTYGQMADKTHRWKKWRGGRKDCRVLMVNKADGQRKKQRKKENRGKIQKHAAVKHYSLKKKKGKTK